MNRLGLTMSVLTMGACLAEVHIRVQFPTPFALTQRDHPNGGTMRVRGTVEGNDDPGAIEARFNGGDWQQVDPAPKDGAFAGVIQARTGQGNLDVRCKAAPDAIATVANVSVGDLFVVTGQSNADGRGGHMVDADESNPMIGSKFRAGVWSRGSDPSDSSGQYASPWPIVLNTLIRNEGVPMGFIQTATGSTVVKQWRKSGNMFPQMAQAVAAATDGTMLMKAVLYYQGENDITHHNTQTVLGDYVAYRENLLAMAAEFHALLNAPILIGQITNLLDFRDRNDNIRRAQQESWGHQDYILPGAVTYDIFPTDGVHYRDAVNMRAFAQRWGAAIDRAFYRRLPQVDPQLLEVRRLPDNRLRIRYNCDLAVSTWDGKTAERPVGFRLVAEETEILGDADVTSCRVDQDTVDLQFRQPIPAAATYWYGSGADAQGKPVLRDAHSGQPVPLVWARPLD